MPENQIPGKAIVNPPLTVIGIPPKPDTKNPPLIGFTFQTPNGTHLAIMFDPTHAQLFIADLIQGLNKMTGIIKPKADA